MKFCYLLTFSLEKHSSLYSFTNLANLHERSHDLDCVCLKSEAYNKIIVIFSIDIRRHQFQRLFLSGFSGVLVDPSSLAIWQLYASLSQMSQLSNSLAIKSEKSAKWEQKMRQSCDFLQWVMIFLSDMFTWHFFIKYHSHWNRIGPIKAIIGDLCFLISIFTG